MTEPSTPALYSSAPAIERAVDAYRSRFGDDPTLVVRAPGRVNLIGEHTDYNDGFVMPLAIPFDVVVAAAPNDQQRVQAWSEGFSPIDFAIDDPPASSGWGAYLHGMAAMLRQEQIAIAGWQGCLAGDIPKGASLSSSAALEMAAGLTFATAAGSVVEATTLARLGQRVENEVLGLPSGIMDQLASATGVDGAASLIDCRSLATTPVPVPADVDIVIMDTGTRRELVESEYGRRRDDCRAAAAAMGVASLRDATVDQLDAIDDERVRRRARHVLAENARTLDAARAMRSGDSAALGALMAASHRSLRDDYEVSGPALDHIVDCASMIEGCLGARMTGGGFAGAAVALVERSATEAFTDTLLDSYRAPAAQPAVEPVRLYAVRPVVGASVLRA